MSLTIAQFAGGASENFVKSLSIFCATRRSRFIGSRQKAAGAADGKSVTSPKRFTQPARMAADLFQPPLSYCWTMIFFEKAFALCEVMLYFEGTA
ncbi:hypothetical protein [Mesorhizobium prunaredense]|nr:hypothetical protein [Mesorhizobium prunaredense]